MTKLRLIAASCATAIVLASCGTSAANANSALGVLQSDVALVRATADAHNSAGAQAAVEKLVADVRRLQAAGQLTSSRANTILNAVIQVDAALRSTPSPSTTAPTTTTTTLTTTTTTTTTTTPTTTPTTTVPVPSYRPPGNAGDKGSGGGGKKDH